MPFASHLKKVLAASGRPLTISQIIDELTDLGHTNVTLKQVNDELGIAVKSGLVRKARRIGLPYQTRLNPPPADPRCCHPARTKA